MAAFCAFFPWCTPEVFWALPIGEYQVLADVIREAAKEAGRG